MLWVRIKGNVGRQYFQGTKFQDVLRRSQNEFHELDKGDGQATIGKIIESLDKKKNHSRRKSEHKKNYMSPEQDLDRQ